MVGNRVLYQCSDGCVISLLTAGFLVRYLTRRLVWQFVRLVLNHYGSLHSRELFGSEFKCALQHICN